MRCAEDSNQTDLPRLGIIVGTEEKRGDMSHQNCVVCDNLDRKFSRIRTEHRAAMWSVARQSSWDNPEIARITQSENEKIGAVMSEMQAHVIGESAQLS